MIAGVVTLSCMAVATGAFFWWKRSQVPAEEPQPQEITYQPPGVLVAPSASEPGGSTTEDHTPGRPGATTQGILDHPVAATEPTGTPPMTSVKALIRGTLLKDEAILTSILSSARGEPAAADLVAAILEGRLSVDRDTPVTDLGREERAERWLIHFVLTENDEAYPVALRFEPDANGEWRVGALSGASLPAGAKQASPTQEVIELAEQFVQSLVRSEIAQLRQWVIEETVPNEKLAALGIIFDEAKFEPIPERALQTTNVSSDRAWVIAKVRSATYNLPSEFGIELKKQGEQWLIERINFSKLMRELTEMAPEDEAYGPPLVSTPSGGDSIVLYFGYDDDKLTSRSLKQLTVVADLLRNERPRKITIGGHADALGEDTYNEKLSQARAERVADALASLGVSRTQIQLEAFGERRPLSPNLNPDGSDNPSGRERNRRTEIYLDF